jgi:aryl-alcohol dehydrogenase-like predicted oxidoreductase
MTITRRDVLKSSAGGTLMLLGRSIGGQPAPLIKKLIPSTGEQITPVGLGTNRYGVGSSESARAPLRATLERFRALGGQLIDTAEEYGSAESVIGDLSAEIGVLESIFIATKVRMIGRDAGIRSIEQSFRRLRKDPLDLVQIHDLTDFDAHIGTLRDLKASGRIRYLGVTTSGTQQHAEMERLMLRETFDFIQLSYALDDRAAAQRLLPLAADRGMAVIVNLPFGRGDLFRAVGEQPLPDWAADFDCFSWAQFFLKYVISHPAVTCAIPGMRQERHAVDNLGAARGRLPDGSLRALQERYFDALA